MDQTTTHLLQTIGIEVDNQLIIQEQLIPREILLSDFIYETIKQNIPDLKQHYSSSFMTSLQKNADKSQKWPLLNLTRQILNTYGYKMEPIRKADGYTLDGVKKYKRYFLVTNKINKQKIENKYNDSNELNHQDYV